MPAIPRSIIMLFVLFVLFVFGFTFVQAQTTAVQSGVTITAAATGERVRITAPSSVVQMHVEVYGISGERVVDQEIRGGNVFDWHLQNGQAERLAPGTYVCVVTAKTTAGRITQRIGTVIVAENSASVQPVESSQLSAPQSQSIGPVEENSSWTVAGKDEPQTPTVIANDGKDGQMIRGRGALTFRIGNFFSGIDTEQMRLTEEGNLGVGTSEPKAKLDVAGTVRAERFLIAKPTKTSSGDTAQTAEAAAATQPLAAGAGTWNQLVKWMDDTGTLGDSVISESGGNIGIGTTTPGADTHLQVKGIAPGAQISSYSTATTATNYGIDAGAVGPGALSNVGGLFMASGGDTNKGIYIFGVSASEYNYAIYSDAEAKSYFAGNVGIGTKYPARALHIKTPSDQQLMLDNDGGDYTSLYFANNGLIKGNVYLRNDPFNEFRLGGVGVNTATVFTANTDVERMRIAANGNVGIGTQSPASRLTVAGTIESTSGGIKFPDGTTQTTAGGSSNAYVQKVGDTMTGVLNLPANGLVAGTNQLVLSGGNVGMGKAPSSDVRLDVQGNVKVSSGVVTIGTGTPPPPSKG